MRFFLDNCISLAMARAVKELASAKGIEVIHLSDRFARDTPDPIWLSELGAEGWIIVSGDTRISKSKVERLAWHESGLTVFFLDDGWSSKNFWVQAAELVRFFPEILRVAKDHPSGAGFLLKFKANSVRQIYP